MVIELIKRALARLKLAREARLKRRKMVKMVFDAGLIR